MADNPNHRFNALLEAMLTEPPSDDLDGRNDEEAADKHENVD